MFVGGGRLWGRGLRPQNEVAGEKDVSMTMLFPVGLVSSWKVLLWNSEGLSGIDEIWIGEMRICLSPQ